MIMNKSIVYAMRGWFKILTKIPSYVVRNTQSTSGLHLTRGNLLPTSLSTIWQWVKGFPEWAFFAWLGMLCIAGYQVIWASDYSKPEVAILLATFAVSWIAVFAGVRLVLEGLFGGKR